MPHTAAKDRPWLWSAGPPASDGVNRNLLERGFHIAWINVNDLYGNTEALSHWEAFYDWAVKEQRSGSRRSRVREKIRYSLGGVTGMRRVLC